MPVEPDPLFDKYEDKSDDAPVLISSSSFDPPEEFSDAYKKGFKDFVKILNERPEVVESGLVFEDRSQRENDSKYLSPAQRENYRKNFYPGSLVANLRSKIQSTAQ